MEIVEYDCQNFKMYVHWMKDNSLDLSVFGNLSWYTDDAYEAF